MNGAASKYRLILEALLWADTKPLQILREKFESLKLDMSPRDGFDGSKVPHPGNLWILFKRV